MTIALYGTFANPQGQGVILPEEPCNTKSNGSF